MDIWDPKCIKLQHCVWRPRPKQKTWATLQWRHNEHDGVSDHQPHDCLLNRLFMCRSRETWKFRATGLCAGNSPVTGKSHAQRAGNEEMFPFDDVIMIWWYMLPITSSIFCWKYVIILPVPSVIEYEQEGVNKSYLVYVYVTLIESVKLYFNT